MSDPIIEILKGEYIKPAGKAAQMCEAIKARHPGRVLALVYYGSSLREMNNSEKMLDFYVIVDSYRKAHRNPLRMLLNAMLPPSVYYHEIPHENDEITTCKYSLISIKGFERRAGKSALLSTVWGRFSQPSIILYPKDENINERLYAARAKALRHIASETAPLFRGAPVSCVDFWARGFRESYRTELRPESSESRSREIVTRYEDRYVAVMNALYGQPDEDGYYALPPGNSAACKFRWLLRRIIGKTIAPFRILSSAATFDGGIDYVLRKLHNHSGVTIDVTPSQRRHPVLWSPVLGWKLWRKGAFR